MKFIEEDKIREHFNNCSNMYDINNEKLYWKLSDTILWNIIDKHLPRDKKFNFLDIGGGTGEWTHKILIKYPLAHATIIDFSSGMLKQARKKLFKFKNRISIIEKDIKDVETNEKYDFIINIYFLPFFEDLDYLYDFISSHLKEKGISISVAENYYNAMALNILKGDISSIINLKKSHYGYLSKYVPALRFDKIDDLIRIHLSKNLKINEIYGFPVLSLIGVKEILSSNENSITSVLENHFNEILNMELEHINNPNLINRGKYICVIGEKK